jgi:hypothetical protein
MTKKFKICLYEKDNFITIQRRICFFWITLVDDDNEIRKFKSISSVEEYLNREKKFGDIYTVEYQKISY